MLDDLEGRGRHQFGRPLQSEFYELKWLLVEGYAAFEVVVIVNIISDRKSGGGGERHIIWTW